MEVLHLFGEIFLVVKVTGAFHVDVDASVVREEEEIFLAWFGFGRSLRLLCPKIDPDLAPADSERRDSVRGAAACLF